MVQPFKIVLLLLSAFVCSLVSEDRFTFKNSATKPIELVKMSINNTTVAASPSASAQTTLKLNVLTTVKSILETTKSLTTNPAVSTSKTPSTTIATTKPTVTSTSSATSPLSTLKNSLATTTAPIVTSTNSTTPTTTPPTTTSISTSPRSTTLTNPVVTTMSPVTVPTTTPPTTTSISTPPRSTTLTNPVVTTMSPMTENNCFCVTNGSCSLVGGNSTNVNDGAGQIDLRIVNPAKESNVTSGTKEAITSPVSSGIPTIAEAQTDCSAINKNLNTCCPAEGYQCGKAFPPMPNSRNLAGRAKFGEFPWQGIIFTIDGSYVGSCVLIDQLNVLTVAHRLNRFPKSLLKIRFGDWDTSVKTEPLPFLEFNVSQVTINPGYVSTSLVNNVAVLRLQQPVPLGRYPTIGTACLPAQPILKNLTCFVSGWGVNDFAYGSTQSIQRKVDVTIVSKKECQKILRMTKLGNNFVLDKGFMCAGGESGKDACTGDGGAPLVCQVANRWYAVGLVSWGISCGQEIPGVYMDINSYVPWIQNVTSKPCYSCAS